MKSFLINIKQIFIFGVYLLISSKLLDNHSGGADIFFAFVVGVFIVIHFVLTLYLVKNNKFWKKVDVIILMILIAAFCCFFEDFLKFMWEYTHR